MSSGLAMLAAAAAPIVYAQGPSVPWARIVLSLMFCIALAVAAIAFIRWRSGQATLGPLVSLMPGNARSKPRRLELLERLPLTATSQICLVRCGDSRVLILVSPGGAQVIERLEPDGGQDPAP